MVPPRSTTVDSVVGRLSYPPTAAVSSASARPLRGPRACWRLSRVVRFSVLLRADGRMAEGAAMHGSSWIDHSAESRKRREADRLIGDTRPWNPLETMIVGPSPSHGSHTLVPPAGFVSQGSQSRLEGHVLPVAAKSRRGYLWLGSTNCIPPSVIAGFQDETLFGTYLIYEVVPINPLCRGSANRDDGGHDGETSMEMA